MGQPGKHNVPESAAGFVFQFARALAHLASTSDGTVGIETLDDVALVKGDGSLVLEQDKLSFQVSRNPLTDRSKNLWNTLAIWCDNINLIAEGRCQLFLVTNQPLPDCLTKRLGLASDDDAVADCIRSIRTCSSDQQDVQLLIEKVSAIDDYRLGRLIKAITVCDGGYGYDPSTIQDATMQSLQCPRWVSVRTVAEGLMGWVVETTMHCWRSRKAAWLSHEAFNQRKYEIIFELRRLMCRERPEHDVLVTEEEKAEARLRRFVEHLNLIAADPEETSEAIEDFLRFNVEQSRLLIAGEITRPQWKAFFNSLTRRWKNIRRVRLRAHGGEAPETVGYYIYSETCGTDFLAPLAGAPTQEKYLTSGGYHALSDGDSVWWHPEFAGDEE